MRGISHANANSTSISECAFTLTCPQIATPTSFAVVMKIPIKEWILECLCLFEVSVRFFVHFKFPSVDFSVSFAFSLKSFHSFSPLPAGSNCWHRVTLTSAAFLHAILYVQSMPVMVCRMVAPLAEPSVNRDVVGLPACRTEFTFRCNLCKLARSWASTCYW